METRGKEESPSNSTVKKWAAEFKSRRERESVDVDGRFGILKDATADENVKVVHTLVMSYRTRDLQSMASEVGIRFGAVQSIITDDILGMSKVSER